MVQYNKNDIKEDATKLYKIMKYFKIPYYANQLICLCLGDCKLIYYIIVILLISRVFLSVGTAGDELDLLKKHTIIMLFK